MTVPTAWSHFVINVPTGDASHPSDIGIYGPCTPGQSAPLVADAGPADWTSTGLVTFTPTQTTPILSPPGEYFIGLTSTASTYQVDVYSEAVRNYFSIYTSQGGTTNGQLNSSITCPSSVSSYPAYGIIVTLGP